MKTIFRWALVYFAGASLLQAQETNEHESLTRESPPFHLGTGAAHMDIGLAGTFAAGTSTARDIEGGTQLGGHDPVQRGFTVQGVEANFSGGVDPHLHGNVNVLFQVNSDGESLLELEEAWLETGMLPGNFRLRAGQMLTAFGRVNTLHTHEFDFVDAPLVSGRFLGPDGLRNPGARITWFAPEPLHAHVSLDVQNSHGETAHPFRASEGHTHGSDTHALPFGYRHSENDRGIRGLADLLFAPRIQAEFDLRESQTVVAGLSAAFGPNNSGETGAVRTRIYGVDLHWKWMPERAQRGYPFVSWQAEGMLREYELGGFDWDENANGVLDPGELLDLQTGSPAVLPRETITDFGFYSQVLYGFRPGWVAGLRFDYVGGERARYERANLQWNGETAGRDLTRGERWRLSPNLTWQPTEYSKLRFQYNYDDRRGRGVDHSVWLQFELLLGAHAGHASHTHDHK